MQSYNNCCPFCNETIRKQDSSGVYPCKGFTCNYSFIFRDSFEDAKRKFAEIVSFGEKALVTLKDNTYAIAYLDEVKPYKICNITDIVDIDSLTLLQNGLVEKVKLPASIIYIDITDPCNKNKYKYLNYIDYRYYPDDLCRILKEDDKLNESYCNVSAIDHIHKLMNNYNIAKLSEEEVIKFKCHANKLHLITPIIVNNRILAFIIFGGIMQKGDELTLPQNGDISRILKVNPCIMQDVLNNSKTEQEIDGYIKSIKLNKKVAQELIREIYLSKRRLTESYFFSYLKYTLQSRFKKMYTNKLFEDDLAKALNAINSFTSVHYSVLLLNDYLDPLTYKVIAVSEKPHLQIQKMLSIKENDFIHNFFEENYIRYYTSENFHEMIPSFTKIFPNYAPPFIALVPLLLSDSNNRGILILVNRSIKIGEKYKAEGSPAFAAFIVSLKRELEMGIGILNFELRRINYLTNISHEIINPLDKIKGRVEFMIREHLLVRSAEYKNRFLLTLEDLLQKCIEMEMRAKSIIKETRYLPEPLGLEKLDLSDLIETNVHNLLEKARARKIKIAYFKTKELWIPRFLLNKEYFSSSIFNVLENAIKYSFQDSVIDIEIKVDHDKNIYKICFSNWGIGVLEKEQERIFGLEERGSNVITHGSGLGRGLHIVKEGLSRHRIGNNKIELTLDRLDAPTIFSINIPFAFKVEER